MFALYHKYDDINLTIELFRLLFDIVLMIKASCGIDFNNTSLMSGKQGNLMTFSCKM